MVSPTHASERLFFVDWLRIGAFALLVLYHVGMVYVPWDFHIKHDPTYPALAPLMRLTNPWRMGLLFVVSGLVSGLLVQRMGFMRQRTRRLLLPLLLGVAVLVPPQAWLQVRDQYGYAGSYADFLGLYFSFHDGFCRQGRCLQLPTWNHLWFLPYLWCYTLALVLVLRVLPRRALQQVADTLASQRGWPLLAVPVLMLAVLRVWLFPRFGETHALLDDAWAHAAYGTLFAAGVLLAQRQQLLAELQALRWPALMLALLAWAAMVLADAAAAGGTPLSDAARQALRAAFATAQWCGIVAAFGFARRHLQGDHPWRSALNEAVFPLYLVHQTVIVGGAVALRPLALPAGIEAALLVVLSVAGGGLVWLLARRVRVLRPWLGVGDRVGARPGRCERTPPMC